MSFPFQYVVSTKIQKDNRELRFICDDRGAVLIATEEGKNVSFILELEEVEQLEESLKKAAAHLKEAKRTPVEKAAHLLWKQFMATGGFPAWLQSIAHNTKDKITVYAKRKLFHFEQRDVPPQVTIDGVSFPVEVIIIGNVTIGSPSV